MQITGGGFLILSAKNCPDTMIYRESSSPCMDTCSHLEISSLCEEHYMDGCFCPEGKCYYSYCMWTKLGALAKEVITKILNVVNLYLKN